MIGWLRRLRCIVRHDYVVWVRLHRPARKHPAIGTWSRCRRCGHERDWLFTVPGMGEESLVLNAQTGEWERLGTVLSDARRGPEGEDGIRWTSAGRGPSTPWTARR